MTVASTYAAAAANSIVMVGSTYDHVSAASLTATGTIGTGSDADGDYFEAASQPSNYLTTPTLNRVTKAAGATWVVKFKTTQTGIMSLLGEIDTGTNYLENLVLNQGDVGGTVTNGQIGIYIRGPGGAVRYACPTTNPSLNDGSAHTVVIEWIAGTTGFTMYIDGSSVALTYTVISGGDPVPTSGAANFPHFVLARNVRGTADQQAVAKVYVLGRLLADGFDLASLSSSPESLVGAGAATAVTLTGPTSGTSGVASSNFTVGLDGTPPSGDTIVTPNDGGDGGTFTPTTVTINSGSPTGTFTYTPASTGTKTISVTNDGGLSNPSSISYTSTAANSAPSWSGTPSAMSAKRGQTLTPQDITSLVSDADLDTLSYSITGAPTGVTINSSTGVISGTPTAAPGVYACTVEADDGIASPVSSSSFNITVTQCVLALNSAGYEFGDGNDPATMSVVASTELQVAAYPLTEWPPASAIATATATTGTNGRLADLGDDDLIFGTTYRVIARNAADGETWAWTMAAS